jgi:intraflagellar transport protein 140
MNDRIHLKNTYYNQAKYYENVGQFKAAIQNYELSGTHQFEVVRMLMDDPDELLEYSIRSQDKVVQHFWAEHLECSGELDNALEQYRLCGDIQSTVRLLLYTQNEERAIRIVEETRDKGAAYHVAKLFAQSDEV